MAAGDYSGRVALGGNRIGKTKSGAYECMLAITNEHPCRNYPTSGMGWIVGIDYKKILDPDLPMFNEFMPKHIKSENCQSKFYVKDMMWLIETPNGEWKVFLKSSEASVDSFSASKLDWIWFDEEPKKNAIFNECMMRLIDNRGVWWMTATPILGTIWLKKLSEREDVYSCTGGMMDNPYLPLEKVEEEAAKLSEEERDVRIYGKYVLFGGNPVFRPISVLNRDLKRIEDDVPAETGTIKHYEGVDPKGTLPEYEFVPKPELPGDDLIRIYKPPEKDERYSVGVDGATGVGRDYTSIMVWSNRIPFEQVAWYHSKNVSTVDGSKIMVDLGYYYNTALLIPERNHPGNAYVDNAIEVYAYPNVYLQETHLERDITVGNIFGFKTTKASKQLLVNDFKGMYFIKIKGVFVPDIIFHDPFTVQAFLNFIYVEDKDHMEAIEGSVDDPVMGSLLAIKGCSISPQARRIDVKKPQVLDEDKAHKAFLLKTYLERDLNKVGVQVA